MAKQGARASINFEQTGPLSPARMYFPASSITAGDSFDSRGSIAASKKKWREATLAAIIH